MVDTGRYTARLETAQKWFPIKSRLGDWTADAQPAMTEWWAKLGMQMWFQFANCGIFICIHRTFTTDRFIFGHAEFDRNDFIRILRQPILFIADLICWKLWCHLAVIFVGIFIAEKVIYHTWWMCSFAHSKCNRILGWSRNADDHTVSCLNKGMGYPIVFINLAFCSLLRIIGFYVFHPSWITTDHRTPH